MGAAIDGADVVGKAKNAVGVGIHAPLQCRFHRNTILFGVHINDLGMQRILFRIHVGDVFLDAAFVEVDLFVGVAFGVACRLALIAKHDANATVEVGQLTQPGRQGGVIKNDAAREDFDVGLEAHTGACAAALIGRLIVRGQAADRSAPLKTLTVHFRLPANGDLYPFTQSVDH